MLIVPIDEVRPGMTLAAPVFNPAEPDQELLHAGYTLEPVLPAKLRDLGVTSVYVTFPGLDDLDRHLAAQLSPARHKLYTQVKQTIVSAQQHTQPTVSFADYYVTTRELVLALLSHGDTPIFLDQMSGRGGNAVTHAAAVAHLSLVLGLKLDTYLIRQRSRLPAPHAREVVNVGVAGMLHDIGKVRLSPEAAACTALTHADDPVLREQAESHPRVGYELVRNGIEASAAVAILQHHQHYDGTGFPAVPRKGQPAGPLAGEQIHVFARIVAIADLFDHLATDPDAPAATGARRPNLLVLRDLHARFRPWLDPVILGMLDSVTPPFVPGSRLTLSDGTRAVVVLPQPNHPYRPVVRAFLPSGNGLAPHPTRLLERPDLSITEADGLNADELASLAEAHRGAGLLAQRLAAARAARRPPAAK